MANYFASFAAGASLAVLAVAVILVYLELLPEDRRRRIVSDMQTRAASILVRSRVSRRSKNERREELDSAS